VASFINYKPSFFFHYSVRVETPNSLLLHASSCVTSLLARSRGMPSSIASSLGTAGNNVCG
jgi:hypothetical protein